jgi:DNA-binding response OmpR family regulator
MSTPLGIKILVIEDDTSIQLGLRMNLERAGYAVHIASDGDTGLEALRSQHWDLVILDIMLPKLNGYELLKAKSEEGDPTPVLILSARTEEKDKVSGLDLGAEDYVTKPFGVRELLARVRASLRRAALNIRRAAWSFGDVTIDTETREVTKAGCPVELTATEFDVLSTLVSARGRALSRKQIFEAVWGRDHHGTHRTIDNFIAQLRSKLEDNPTSPLHLLTVRGVGYRVAE